ncbi:MAG: pilus assembly protein [Chloroflexota bacterium]|nr:pilus assembly protein [Chloroflexota bacterium]
MPSIASVSTRLAKARLIRGQAGQSLVELAISLPVLLLIVLGLADVGRAFYYTSAIANAAREGAIFASRQATASDAAVAQHACNETGFAAYGTACPSELIVTRTCSTACATAGDVTVQVTYDLTLMTAYAAQNILHADPIRLRAASTFPVVAP